MPGDNHGDSRNFTKDDLEAAAEVAGLSVEEAAANIEEAVEGFDDEDYEEIGEEFED